MDWQTIDTAPMDGSEMVVWSDPRIDIYGGLFVAHWGNLNSDDDSAEPFWCWITKSNGKGDWLHLRSTPSHWLFVETPDALEPPPQN